MAEHNSKLSKRARGLYASIIFIISSALFFVIYVLGLILLPLGKKKKSFARMNGEFAFAINTLWSTLDKYIVSGKIEKSADSQ